MVHTLKALFSHRRAAAWDAFSGREDGAVKLIAHRGLTDRAPENTLAAFRAAGESAVFGIETDVHRTKCGAFVVIHDETTGRVADSDLRVNRSTLSDLRALTLHMPNGKEDGEWRIPTLSEYLAVCKEYQKAAFIELKYGMSKEDIRALIEEVHAADYLKETAFISFTFSYLVFLREELPKTPLFHLTTEVSEKEIRDLVFHRIGISLLWESLNAKAAARLRAAHIPTGVFTVDDEHTARRLSRLGATYITTNRLTEVNGKSEK